MVWDEKERKGRGIKDVFSLVFSLFIEAICSVDWRERDGGLVVFVKERKKERRAQESFGGGRELKNRWRQRSLGVKGESLDWMWFAFSFLYTYILYGHGRK